MHNFVAGLKPQSEADTSNTIATPSSLYLKSHLVRLVRHIQTWRTRPGIQSQHYCTVVCFKNHPTDYKTDTALRIHDMSRPAPNAYTSTDHSDLQICLYLLTDIYGLSTYV